MSITFNTLREAAKTGGAAALVRKEHLSPVGGYDELVDATKYPDPKGKGSINQYLLRNIEGEVKNTVTLASKQDQLNRIEKAIFTAPEDSPLAEAPRTVLTYEGVEGLPELVESDLTLSHRVFDAHLMLGTMEHDGKLIKVTEHPDYIALRDSAATDMWALLHTSPATLVFGAWDSARKSGQTRIASSVVGDTYGVLADQNPVNPSNAPVRSALKLDVIGSSYDIDNKDLVGYAADRRGGKPGKTKFKPSEVGLGPVPGTSIAGVAVADIVRSTIISINTLRTLRFGAHYAPGVTQAEGDATARALLLAYVLAGRTYADLDGFLRANCHLVVIGSYPWQLVASDSSVIESFEALTTDEADALLAEAIAEAAKVGINWNGNRMAITGDQGIRRKATEDSEA